MPISPRTIIFVALFNLAIGFGLVMGWLFGTGNLFFYETPVRYIYQNQSLSIEEKGFDDEGNIVFVPYNYNPCPQIPLVAMHREAAESSFSTVPPGPMDWAVLLFQLHNTHGVSNICISAPLVWKDVPIELATYALTDTFQSFTHTTIGKALTLSARSADMPKEWGALALKENQYIGDTGKLPPGNKLFGEDGPDFTHCVTAPSHVENEDLFHATPQDTLSAPLFIRWDKSVLPTSNLLSALFALNLTIEDIHVHFGDKLRIGKNIVLPIDEASRIGIRPDANPVILTPADVIFDNTNLAMSEKSAETAALLKNSPLTYIWEPLKDNNCVDSAAIHSAKTISSLLTGITPQEPIVLKRLSTGLMWVLLVDLVVIALWGLRFRTMIRRIIFAVCFVLIACAGIFFFMRSHTWLPIITLATALLFVCIASFFVAPSNTDADDQDDDSPADGEMPVESLEFHEPNEVPIPKKHNGSSKK